MTTKKKKKRRERGRNHKGGGDKIFSCLGSLVFFCVFLLLLSVRSDSDDYQVIASAIFLAGKQLIQYVLITVLYTPCETC